MSLHQLLRPTCTPVRFPLRIIFKLVFYVNFTAWLTNWSLVFDPSIYSLLQIPIFNSFTSIHSIIALFINHFLFFGFSWSSIRDSVLVLLSSLILFVILCIFSWIPDCLQALSEKLILILLVFSNHSIISSWIAVY